MATAFRDFLREHAEKHRAEAEAGRAKVDEWRAAIERLFAQLRGWLKESDPEGVIEIKEGQQVLTENGLGRYTVPRLDLRVFETWIGVIPKARNTVGAARPPQQNAPQRAAGRVDITDEIQRYILYRFHRDGGEDEWVIDDLRAEQRPLDQQAFEQALMSYLR